MKSKSTWCNTMKIDSSDTQCKTSTVILKRTHLSNSNFQIPIKRPNTKS